MKPIDILLYEDKKEYADSFKLIAAKSRIIVHEVNNADSLLETLDENPRKHKFVVLDAKAFLHEGQTAGTESEAPLHKIFREIKRIEAKQKRIIPYCINTGFSEFRLQHAEVLDCPIFEKGNETELLTHVWDTYNNTEQAKLRKDYPDVFEFADQYFDDADAEVLTSLLLHKKYESEQIADIISSLAALRRLCEHSMDIIFSTYLGNQEGIIRNRSSRASDIVNYLNGQSRIPTQIFGTVVNILKTGSNYGSHTPEQATAVADYPGKNTVVGLVHSYFEVAKWCTKLLR
jgi:hypothetical protein